MPIKPDDPSKDDLPTNHPRYNEYLAECNAFWVQKQENNSSATFPLFREWLAGKEPKTTAQANPEPKVTPPPKPKVSFTQQELDELNRKKIENINSHPRFSEWLKECEIIGEIAHQANDPSLNTPPSFNTWLRLKQEDKERERNRPRIRSANPPLGNVYHGKKLFNKVFRPTYAESLLSPFSMHAYPVQFTLVLADTSTLTTNVHFEIPTQNMALMDQLNRVVETELVIFARDKKHPPSPDQLQDHLHLVLVPFQNENDIAVLKVKVTLVLHTPNRPSDKGEIYV